jgi:uncharacterized protein YndB with AHSA1/START domain
MNKLNFSIVIQAPRAQVWNVMLGAESYPVWTALFCEGSYFEGAWEAGARIRFLSPSGGGMTSVIAENRLHEYLSIKHLGYIHNGVEDTESESVRSWAPAFENYSFREAAGGTEVRVEVDITAEYESYMRETWPQALAKLKEICQAQG